MAMLATLLVASAPAATVNWVSYPLRPGETALLSGGGFSSSSKIELTASDGTKTAASALDVSESALKFTVPSSATGALDVSVDGSEPYPLNVPDVWWWQVSAPKGGVGSSCGGPPGR